MAKQCIIIICLALVSLLSKGKEVKTQILILAPPDKIWGILMDIGKYPEWNTFMKILAGKYEKREKIKVKIFPPDTNPMTFKPTILAMDLNRGMCWRGHLLIPGIFDGRHYFELVDNGNGTTTFIHREVFKGFLVGLFKKKLDNNTKRGFEEMNQQLKKRAEM
jgi:hypothetical protein